jgi:hypothetical protein
LRATPRTSQEVLHISRIDTPIVKVLPLIIRENRSLALAVLKLDKVFNIVNGMFLWVEEGDRNELDSFQFHCGIAGV